MKVIFFNRNDQKSYNENIHYIIITSYNNLDAYVLKKIASRNKTQRKYSGSPHITDKHMRFSPPPANASGGYTLI